jgi:hypothetical protein
MIATFGERLTDANRGRSVATWRSRKIALHVNSRLRVIASAIQRLSHTTTHGAEFAAAARTT